MHLLAPLVLLALPLLWPLAAGTAASEQVFLIRIDFQPGYTGFYDGSYVMAKQNNSAEYVMSSNFARGSPEGNPQAFKSIHDGDLHDISTNSGATHMSSRRLKRGHSVEFVAGPGQNVFLSFNEKEHLQHRGKDGTGPPEDDVFSLCPDAILGRFVAFDAKADPHLHHCTPIFLVREYPM